MIDIHKICGIINPEPQVEVNVMANFMNGKSGYYRVVETAETVDGHVTAMYGIEGFSHGEFVFAFALSTDKKRISKLVDALNMSGMQLSQFQMILNRFSKQ